MNRLYLLFLTLVFFGCSSVETRDESYVVLTRTGTLSKADLGDLPPQDAVVYGDTLYVLTCDTNNVSSLSLFDANTLLPLDTWMTWVDTAGLADSLVRAMTLTATENRLYICSVDSRVDVFDRGTLQYITTIGKGNWWANDSIVLVHSYALAESAGKVLVRDKHHIRVFNVDDLSYENKKNVVLQAKSVDLGSNGGANPHGMVIYDGKVFVTSYSSKVIHVFDASQFDAHDTAITPVDSIELNEHPYDISVSHGSLYIVLRNGTVEKRSPESYDLLKQFQGFEGGIFENPSTLQFGEELFFMVEDSLEEISYGTVDVYDVKVYEEE